MGALSGRTVTHCVTARRSTGWRVERSTASPATLLDEWPPDAGDDAPVLRASRVDKRQALVLGSTQDLTKIDERRAADMGIDVIRRTTGGGAVLVAPDAQVWIDVWVPRAEELWEDDVIGAALWLGETWVVALESLGVDSLSVHRGRATRGVLSDLVCFAGLGPGEVHLGAAGTHRAKVMGLAQRRTRRGARFHTSAPLRWDPDPLLALLNVEGADDARRQLEDAALGLRSLIPSLSGVTDVELIGVVEDAVIAALPAV